jgi:hypothetical protein
MAILAKGNDFADGDDVTSTKLDNLVDAATFVSGSSGTTDDSSLEVNGSGRLQVKDSGIVTGKIGASAVTTAKIADATGLTDGVTFSKLRQLETMKTIGNVTGSTAAPTQVDILDEDDMASDSATSLVTQQSVKAYVDDGGGMNPTTYTGGETTTFPNGLIMKFGQDTASPNTSTTVTFGTAFPTGIISVVLTNFSDSTADLNENMKVGSQAASNFTIRNTDGGTNVINWMAIGY